MCASRSLGNFTVKKNEAVVDSLILFIITYLCF